MFPWSRIEYEFCAKISGYAILLFELLFGCPTANYGPLLMRQPLTHSMLITFVLRIRPKGHRESRNKVGSLNPTERLVGLEPRTFQF